MVALAALSVAVNHSAFPGPAPEDESPAINLTAEVYAASIPTPLPLSMSADLGVTREIVLHTNIPTRPRVDVLDYTVVKGDSVFGIAEKYGLKPETILWGNYSALNDDPHLLRPGQVLKILPVDGTYYQWQAGDRADVIARFFGVTPESILDWPGNQINGDAPEGGAWVVVPGGVREFRRWVAPTIPRGNAGVGASVGPGACPSGGKGGATGTGGFIWPSARRDVSGNDYWAGHLAIDIGAYLGDPVYAADSGVVVFAGWAYGGYGNMVMLDHGNGWQTLYSHLSAWYVSCGQSVSRGASIGAAGSTGNSTGTHLHFETRLNGGFVNPWLVLP